MARWFRMHDELLDDPKVQLLPAEDFKAWVNLLCLASRNNGILPTIGNVSFALRLSPTDVERLYERMLSAGLIARHSGGAGGAHYAPHKWNERQYKSDTSTERVKRFRKRCGNADETPSETETETEEVSSDTSKRQGADWGRPPVPVAGEVWNDFKANRRKKRLANTATAYKKLCEDLGRISAASGMSESNLLSYAASRGWGAVYDPTARRNGGTNGTPTGDRTIDAAVSAFGHPDTWSDEQPF